MYRRFISICVLAGFIVAQWVATPHGHAQGSPHDHGAIPHVHLSALSVSSHKHEHGHTHGHTHHHGALSADRDGYCHSECISRGTDHEADAIYLPQSVTTTATSGVDQTKLLASPVVLHFVDAAAFGDPFTAYHAALLRLPGERAPGCNFCLTLRALRI